MLRLTGCCETRGALDDGRPRGQQERGEQGCELEKFDWALPNGEAAVDSSENLLLRALQEIGATLENRFDNIDRQLEGLRGSLPHRPQTPIGRAFPEISKANPEASARTSSQSTGLVRQARIACELADSPAHGKSGADGTSEGFGKGESSVHSNSDYTRLDNDGEETVISTLQPPQQAYQLRTEWSVKAARAEKKYAVIDDKYSSVTEYDYTLPLKTAAQRKWWFIIRPASTMRVICDFCALGLIVYDLLVMPFELAFQVEDSNVSQAIFTVALAFWSAEIPRGFVTGFYDNGVEELRLRKIVVQYMRTWFLFDLCIVSMDWVFMSIGLGTRGAAVARVTKILKIVRICRLIRVAKLRSILESIQDHFASEHFHIGVSMAKLTLQVLFLNHFIACSWYGLSTSLESGEKTAWIVDGHFDIYSDVSYQYLTALHWSLTQFTPASMEVFPRNSPERAFAVVVLVFALLVFSSFLSSITATMTQLRNLSSWFDPKVSMLRRYLRGRGISSNLTIRVLRYVEHRLAAQKFEVQEKDVALLRILSRPLQMELAQQTFEKVLLVHPFFGFCAGSCPDGMRLICSHALSTRLFSAGDIVFTSNASSDAMYILRKGALRYKLKHRSSLAAQDSHNSHENYRTVQDYEDPKKCSNVDQVGQWFCEAALWTQWIHVGTMRVVEDSELVAVDNKSLAEASRKHRGIQLGAAQYGRYFVERLNEIAQSSDIELSDLHFAGLEGVEEDLAAKVFPEQGTRSMSSKLMSHLTGEFAVPS